MIARDVPADIMTMSHPTERSITYRTSIAVLVRVLIVWFDHSGFFGSQGRLPPYGRRLQYCTRTCAMNVMMCCMRSRRSCTTS